MIDCNSNCSRVDAVKATANQLKLQMTAMMRSDRADLSRKVKADLEAVDGHIKSGDAKKAEEALSVARKDLNTSHAEGKRDEGKESPGNQESSRGFLAYA